MSERTEKSLGEEIVEGLSELRNAVKKGDRIGSRFTVRTVQLDLEPQQYPADAVRRTRELLNVSQAVFAQVLAVSTELIESWEQGLRTPSPMACRLLDLINKDRMRWLALLENSLKQATT